MESAEKEMRLLSYFLQEAGGCKLVQEDVLTGRFSTPGLRKLLRIRTFSSYCYVPP